MPLIERISVNKERLDLSKPYILSFQTLTSFEVISVEILADDGRIRTADVVPLFGYSTETYESIYNYLIEKSTALQGLDLREARTAIEADIQNRPFSSTAILTGIDLFETEIDFHIDLQKFQYVTPASTEKVEELIALHEKCCLENRDVLKIKLSGSLETDRTALLALASHIDPEKTRLRLDANQAYTLENGILFFDFLSKFKHLNTIQYVEQPYPVLNWEFNQTTAEKFPSVPIMLDESIITIDDIDRCVEMNLRFIKLKLYKQGGIRELLACAEYANQHGISVILGNGVASKSANIIECSLFESNANLFDSVLESNGFLKLV